jgi:hypothetical protein
MGQVMGGADEAQPQVAQVGSGLQGSEGRCQVRKWPAVQQT